MTISTTANRQDYTGNGCTVAFAYTFKIPAASDLDIYVDNAQKTLTTDYTVSGAGSASGGTVTFNTAPGCNKSVALVRDVAYTQATAYPENDPFPASSHEDALDKLTMLVQQVKELTTRSWRFAAGSIRAAAGYIVDEPVASKYPRIKSDCSGIEYVALEACGTYANPITTIGDLLVGGTAGVAQRLAVGSTNQVVMVRIGEQGQGSVAPPNGCLLYSYIPVTNWLHNGDFEIWGHGDQTIPTSWALTGTNATVVKETNTVRLGAAAAKVSRAATAGLGANAHLAQNAQSGVTRLAPPLSWWYSKRVTAGAWIHFTTSGDLIAHLSIAGAASHSEAHSANHTGGGAWEWLQVTTDLTGDVAQVIVNCSVESPSGAATAGTAYFDGVVLTVGAGVPDWIPEWIGRRTAVFSFMSTLAGIGAGLTRYLGLGIQDATADCVAFPMPTKGVLRRARSRASVVAGVGNTYTYTLSLNGANCTRMTWTASGGTDSAGSCTGQDIVVGEANSITIEVIPSGSANVACHRVTVEFEEVP